MFPLKIKQKRDLCRSRNEDQRWIKPLSLTFYTTYAYLFAVRCVKEGFMSVLISGWLADECDRLKRIVPEYEEQIRNLPKGSISIRKIGSEEYVYLKRRENGKIKSEYIGSVYSESYFDIRSKIVKRNFLIKEIKEIKNQIDDLNYVIEGLKKKEMRRKCRQTGKIKSGNFLTV